MAWILAPLPPGSIVIEQPLWIPAQTGQGKQQRCASYPGLAVHDLVLVTVDSMTLDQLRQLRIGSEGVAAISPMAPVPPAQVAAPGDAAGAPRPSQTLLATSFLRVAAVPELHRVLVPRPPDVGIGGDRKAAANPGDDGFVCGRVATQHRPAACTLQSAWTPADWQASLLPRAQATIEHPHVAYPVVMEGPPPAACGGGRGSGAAPEDPWPG